MKKILAIVALIVLSSPFSVLRSQDAVFKLMRCEWTLNADGTSDYHYRHEVQILRNRAMVAYADKGETFVVYNPDLEMLTVNEVYTIQKDGTRVDMPQNAFIYQLPSNCTDCGRFNHLRELAMVHTGMELGCTIVVDYTIHRQYNMLRESIALQRDCPIEKMEIVVTNNSDVEVNYDVVGKDYITFVADNVAKGNTTTFTYTNVPQAPREPYMPADIVPTLRIFNSAPQFSPAFDQEGFTGARDVMGQVMNSRGMENIVNARNYIVDNIHLNDIAPSHLGYTHATAEEVWRTGCGTATDKAVLLAAILNGEGYRAAVAGENADEVSVWIDTLEYRLPVRHKGPMSLYGKAIDEVKSVRQNGTFDAVLDTLEDGFYSFPIPVVVTEGAVHASSLTTVRTTPLQATACDVSSDVTFRLPKGLKMVGKAFSRKLSYPGLGSVQVSVKQCGSKLRVVRSLKVEKSIIPVADYANYRQLIATWQSPDHVLLRSK